MFNEGRASTTYLQEARVISSVPKSMIIVQLWLLTCSRSMTICSVCFHLRTLPPCSHTFSGESLKLRAIDAAHCHRNDARSLYNTS